VAATATTAAEAPVDATSVATLSNVTRRFGDVAAIDDVSLAVPGGQVFGLIGPSGCGKTTLIRLLLGVLAPTAGIVQIMGRAPEALTPAERARIGYTPQGFFLYPTLTVQENINFVAGLFGIPFWRRRRRIRELLEFLELWPARGRLARDLSGGMQRRLELACALVHRPSLLIVDEPTAGLDPVLRQRIWDYLRSLCDEGTSILVTTQYIDEATSCDTVAIMRKGQVIAVDTPDALRRQAMGGAVIDLVAENLSRADQVALRALPGIRSAVWTGEEGGLRLIVDDLATATPAVIQELQQRDVTVVSANPYEPTFDEVFMKIVGADGR
jgi:ABC-2 type transport system ATP-binding protein